MYYLIDTEDEDKVIADMDSVLIRAGNKINSIQNIRKEQTKMAYSDD